MPIERPRTDVGPGATPRPALRAGAVLLAAITLPATGVPAAADDTAPSPLQARLDALQRIEVTEARAPSADAAPVTPAVQQVLDQAEAAEREDAGVPLPTAADD